MILIKSHSDQIQKGEKKGWLFSHPLIPKTYSTVFAQKFLFVNPFV
jgi:hypothetical protein